MTNSRARGDLGNNGFQGQRAVIGISGDGPSSSGPSAPAARDEAVGVRNVIGGAGAFVMEATLTD